MGKRLAGELIDAYNNRGNAIKKKTFTVWQKRVVYKFDSMKNCLD